VASPENAEPGSRTFYTESMDMSNPTVDSVVEESQPQGAASPSEAAGAPLSVEALAADRDRLLIEKADLQDRLLRRQAEFDNFRRRAERERADVVEYANTETVRVLLPILDDFERALKVESADKEYARGMELIYQRLSESLKKLGIEPITCAGQLFDPHLHHAVEMVETDEHEDHTILEEYQRGYNFKGKLLRPAMVKVAVKKT
jgi:molecular chaperone GrpE